VRLSKDRFRGQYLLDGAACSYAKVTVDDNLAGNAFACRWTSVNLPYVQLAGARCELGPEGV
jgi:hypothetical protein